MPGVTSAELTAGVRELGVSDRVVCLHSSLRSFGHVDGGAAAVVDAFLSEGCTVLVPSFSWGYLVPPPAELRPARNAWDYARPRALPPTGIFDPATAGIDSHMGAIPAEVVRRPDRARGTHPLCSFAAVGPDAARVVAGQVPDDVYPPLRGLAESDGYLVLLGVGLTAATLLHLAEEGAGRTLLRRWARTSDGEIRMVPVGSCSQGFDAFAPLLAPVARETRVGSSAWVAYPAAEALTIAIEAIRREPDLTRCPDPACVLCADSIAGGPLLDQRSS
ncbi:MAG: AAC(3) family N-acetyltransferase [Gaiellaceae bacterium]